LKAVLLVGGEGTRLRPFTLELPKPLVPILNLPYLEQFLFYLEQFHIHELILLAGYLSEKILDFCEKVSRTGFTLKYLVEKEPLGTGGAIKNAGEVLTETFLAFNADVVTSFNLSLLLKFHEDRKAQMTLGLVPVLDPSAFGAADLNPIGQIRRFVEKPEKGKSPSNFINAGIYVIEPEVLEQIPEGKKVSLEREIFPKIAEAGKLYGLKQECYWQDMGTLKNYLQIHRDFFNDQIALKVQEDSAQKEGVFAGAGAQIDSSAEIGPYVVLGENCKIEAGVKISNSVLWKNVVVKEKVHVFNSIIGGDCVISEGSIVSSKAVSLSGEVDI
jgi:mannose-1-phosphate guanylyltransferase